MVFELSLKKMWNSESMSKVMIPLNDAHLELEDDDHDVIHAVFSPLSFKVGMTEVEDICWEMMLLNWM